MNDAVKIISFIEEFCKVPEGKLVGQPIKLLAFQKAFIKDVYDNPHGTRRAILSIGRKNGKTCLLAALVLVHLVGPMAVQNGQLVSGALSKDQAALVYKLAEKMIKMDADLSARCKTVFSSKILYGLHMGTEYRALSAEAGTSFGLSPVFVVLDEIGQVRGPRSAFIDAITTSQGAHDTPLLIAISTQSPSDSDLFSIWIDDAMGGNNPKSICRLHAADNECELLDEAAWAAANPALGTFRSIEDVKTQAGEAKRMPSFENTFRNLILNNRISQTNYFISKDVWKANGDKPDMSVFETCPVWGGLDLSARSDLTAFVLVALDAAGFWHVKPHFWTPQETLLDRAKRDRAPYDLWVKNGFMTATPGTSIDYDYVADEIGGMIENIMDLRSVAFDRWRIDVFKASCERMGVDLPLEKWGQGFKDMAPSLDAVEHAALAEKMRHGNHPVLLHCAANSVVQADASGNRKLAKDKVGLSKIDGMVALAMAMGIATREGVTGNLDDFLSDPLVIGI